MSLKNRKRAERNRNEESEFYEKMVKEFTKMAYKSFTKIQFFGIPDLERSAYRIEPHGSPSRCQEADPLKPYSWPQENGPTAALNPNRDAVRHKLSWMFCHTQIHAIQSKTLLPHENMYTGPSFNLTMVKI